MKATGATRGSDPPYPPKTAPRGDAPPSLRGAPRGNGGPPSPARSRRPAPPGLAELGAGRISYAERSMPLLAALRSRFTAEQPFAGLTIAACLHVTAETAVFARVLRAGGATVRLAASNPLSTQDDIAAALAARDGVAVFARSGVDREAYYEHIALALGAPGDSAPGDSAPSAGGDWLAGPDLILDDGGDLVSTLHTIAPPAVLGRVRGGCEGTTTGVLRLRRMAADATLAFPVIAASDTPVTRIVDNFHGTAQSVIDGLLRASGILLAGKAVVVAGFGSCGAGIADSARALGARVTVTEVDPVRALDAVLRGFTVLPAADAAPLGEVFITATGSAGVITAEHLALMRDGAVLANAGHFDVEIDVRALAALRSRCTPTSARTPTPTSCPTAAACSCWPKAAWSTWSPPTATRPR
jgi:adenosylhomocysteinase